MYVFLYICSSRSNGLDLYSGVAGSKSVIVPTILTEGFHGFLQSLQEMPEYYLKVALGLPPSVRVTIYVHFSIIFEII
jgi:hypothetical protein